MDFFIVCQLGPSANIRENILLGNIMGKNSDPRMEPWGTPFFFISYIVFFFFFVIFWKPYFHIYTSFNVTIQSIKVSEKNLQIWYGEIHCWQVLFGCCPPQPCRWNSFYQTNLVTSWYKGFFNMLQHVIQCKKSLYSNTIALCIPIFLYSGWLQKPEERYLKT